MPERRRAELDQLLVPDAYLGRTPLAWLGIGPTSATPAAVKGELEKPTYLRRLDAHTLDLSMLPTERRRFLAGVGRRLTGQALQRREPERRYPILLTLIAGPASHRPASAPGRGTPRARCRPQQRPHSGPHPSPPGRRR